MSNFQGLLPDGMFSCWRRTAFTTARAITKSTSSDQSAGARPAWSLAEDRRHHDRHRPPDRHRPEPQRLCQPRPAGQPLYRDKSLYRENMWVGFMRDKKAYECAPGFSSISP